jgi:hypothetical protein
VRVESIEAISEENAMNKKPELTHEGGSVSYLNNIPGTPAPAPFLSQVVCTLGVGLLSSQA